MKLKEFGYDLPEKLIAQYPLKDRDQSRLIVIERESGKISHDIFANIGQYLPEQSHVILNDSRVIPARLLGRREGSGGEVEVFLLKSLDKKSRYEALLRPLKRLKTNDKIVFNGGKVSATLVDREKRIVEFNTKNVLSELEKVGHIPLPPYIKRSDQEVDRTHYQTVYAKRNGSVAAPTAGLHFTSILLDELKEIGHRLDTVTLHVNYGTFKPVEDENIQDHQMHCEEYTVSKSTFNALKRSKEKKRKVVAVGTTSCRVIETLAQKSALEGSTDIFMYPGFKFKMTDVLITNFHLPFSTLLMLVYAFGGTELMKKAYREAIEKEYRFYSYGDAMMII